MTIQQKIVLRIAGNDPATGKALAAIRKALNEYAITNDRQALELALLQVAMTSDKPASRGVISRMIQRVRGVW